MGSEFTQYPQLSGLLVPDERITYLRIDEDLSSFTEAGPIPGTPSPNQDTDLSLREAGVHPDGLELEIQTQISGLPIRGGAGYVWKEEDSDTWLGADHPGIVTGHEVLSTTEAVGTAYVIRLSGGRILAVQRDSGAPSNVRLFRFDAEDDSWANLGIISIDGYTFGSGHHPCLVQLSDDRVLLFLQSDGTYDTLRNVDVLVSSDDGDNWSVYALRVIAEAVASNNPLRVRAAVTSAGAMLAIGTDAAGPAQSIVTYGATTAAGPFTTVSADVGAELAADSGGGDTDTHDLISLRDGSFLLVCRAQDSAVYSWVSVSLPSASTPIADGTQKELETSDLTPDVPTFANNPGCALWLGEDGNLYCLASGSTGVGTHRYELLRRSVDGGNSWRLWNGYNISFRESSTDYMKLYGAADMGGRVFVVGQGEDELAERCIYMGGHSSHTMPQGANIAGDFRPESYVCYSQVSDLDAADLGGGLYVPTALPADHGWVRTTPAGAATDALVVGNLYLSGTGTLLYTEDSEVLEYGGIVAEMEIKVSTLTGADTGLQVRLSNYVSGTDATFVYECALKAGIDSLLLVDMSGPTTIDTINDLDFTEFTLVRLAMDEDGNVRTWYGTQGQRREWSDGPSGTLTDTSGTLATVGTRFRWGKLDNSSQESTWSHVGWCGWPYRSTRLSSSTPAAGYSNPEDVRPLEFSPIPQYLRKGVEVYATDGPTLQGDQWSLGPEYTYPVSNIHHEISPAPAAVYRSTTDASASQIVWQIDTTYKGRFRSPTLGLCLLRCNFRTADLDITEDGGISWTTLGEIDLAEGLDSLTFELDGNAVTVDTGTAQTAGRYIWPDEFRGATVKLIGGTTEFRKIKGNTGGSWTDATSKRPLFELEGMDGTEPASGTCEIWARSGVLMVHDITDKATHVRLSISSGDTADGYHECGQAIIGDVFVFGNAPSFGRNITTTIQAETEVDPSGVSYARATGLPIREVDISWDEGMPTRRLYRDTINPDYVTAADGGEPVANRNDVVLAMEALVSQRLEGPTRPVVYLGRIPRGSGSHTITDRSLVIYGRVTSDPSVEPFQGYEGRDEVMRAGRVTVTEIPGGWEAP